MADTASAYLDEVPNSCPFALSTALLALLRTAQLTSGLEGRAIYIYIYMVPPPKPTWCYFTILR